MTEKLNDLLPITPDMQAERLAELKRLFPDMFDGEGQLKLDEVKQLIGDEPQCRERYDFSWYGKRKAKEIAYTPTTATLTYDESRSVNPEKANGNVIIEGENLETLKTLLSSYREAIKCIYIDPPYNTGKDFVYSDNYTEDKRAYWEETGGLEQGVKIDTNPETAGRYHSNWLSMMYSRLLLARQLLKDDGVIFVSIDDNEVHNLRRLMDDVFGEENFVALFSWKTDGNTDNQAKIIRAHEYVIAFAKSVDDFPSPPVIAYNIDESSKLFKEEIRNTIVKNGKKNPISKVLLPKGFPSDATKNIIPARDDAWPHYETDIIISKGKLSNDVYAESGWSSKELLEKFIGNKFKPVLDNKGQESRFVISNTGAVEVIKKRTENQSHVLSTISGFGGPQKASETLSQQGIIFDGYPKPVQLIKYFAEMNYGKNFTMIDFFAGSGVTAQAISELNAEDNGNRKFILVQLPEQTPEKSEARKAGYKKISDITIERVKRIINGYGDEPKPLDTGFKVYQLTKSHFPRTEFKPDPEKSEAENIEVLKDYIKEKEKQLTGLFEASDIQDEVLLKNGFKLNYQLSDASTFKNNTVKLADDGEKQALLCLDNKLNPETVKQLIKNPQAFICLERSLSTDDKWNLRQHLKHEFIAF